MRAVVENGASVAVDRVPVPVPGPREVLIGIEVAGVCRTDIYAARGLPACPDPLVLGHEFAGVVAGCGAEVRRFSPGDRVAMMPVLPCALEDFADAFAADGAGEDRKTFLSLPR